MSNVHKNKRKVFGAATLANQSFLQGSVRRELRVGSIHSGLSLVWDVLTAVWSVGNTGRELKRMHQSTRLYEALSGRGWTLALPTYPGLVNQRFSLVCAA